MTDKRGNRQKIIINKLENGMTFRDACVLAGVTEQTGYNWKNYESLDEEINSLIKDNRELSEDEKIKLSELQNQREDNFRFFSVCETAVIRYKEKLIEIINKGSVKDPRHAAEMLRVRWPKEFNIAKRHEVEANQKIQIDRLEEIIDSLLVS